MLINTKIKYKNINARNININSNKFIRIIRYIKLSNLTLNKFTYFKNRNNNARNQNNQGVLLFLNQGLKYNDIIKLRYNLNIIGINITNISTKLWSNSLIQQNYTKKLKKKIYGNILSLWYDKSNINIYPINYLYNIIHLNILNKNNIYKNKDILNIYKYKSNNIYNLKYIENKSNIYKLILPWDILSNKLINDKFNNNNNINSIMLDNWYNDDNNNNNHVNYLLNLLNNQNLIYIGILNIKYNNNVDCLLKYENRINNKNINKIYELINNICFEQFKLNILNKNYLIYL